MPDSVEVLRQRVDRVEDDVRDHFKGYRADMSEFGQRIAAAIERIASVEERSEERHLELHKTIQRCFDRLDSVEKTGSDRHDKLEERARKLENEQGLTIWFRGVGLTAIIGTCALVASKMFGLIG